MASTSSPAEPLMASTSSPAKPLMASTSSPAKPLKASTSSPAPVADFEILEAAASGNIEKLKEIRARVGNEGKFRRMCDSVSDPTFGLKALHAAAGMGELETCKFLVEEVGVYVDVKTHNGDTPLLLTVKRAHADVATFLIEHGAEIKTTGSRGFTALHCTILNEDTDTMDLLLAKGADIEADSVCGTPLHCAAISGSVSIVNYLLQKQAKANSYSKYLGISPLISAIYSATNALECVDLLLKAKADPKVLGNGLTPLAHAIEIKANSCIKSLLDAGADVDANSAGGFKPIQHAALVDNVEAIKILHTLRPSTLRTLDWSLGKLMDSRVAVKEKRDSYVRSLKQNGDTAWDTGNYASAIASYTKVIHHNPNDAKLYANRSICWARLGNFVFALHDAETCVRLKPDWGKASLREAMAWYLLERYRMASCAFKRAYEKDPENEQIERCGSDAPADVDK